MEFVSQILGSVSGLLGSLGEGEASGILQMIMSFFSNFNLKSLFDMIAGIVSIT
ncbi:MAG: hypothetical protein IKS39_03230 [Clostridia bacterium]|nr:hypothetical protein [Clostridia bacterium]